MQMPFAPHDDRFASSPVDEPLVAAPAAWRSRALAIAVAFAAFAIVGIVALLTATGHAPLTSIVLVVEATQAVTLLPALMLAAAVANVTTMLLNGRPLQRLLLDRALHLLPTHHWHRS